MAQNFTELFGLQFSVDNRPGAGGLIAQTAVVNAAPDGYTILLSGRSLTAAPFLNANVTFDPVRSFAPVAQIVTLNYVLVVFPGVKAHTVSDFIALARARPGVTSYAAAQGGLMPYVAATIFRGMTKTDMLFVPYKSIGPILNDLLSGQVDAFFSPIGPVLSHVRNGRLRALGVTSAARSSAFPDVPSIAEAAVPGYEVVSWNFIAAPARTPRTLIGILNSATARILARTDVREKLLAFGSEPAPASPEEITRRLTEATEQFRRIVKELGIKPQ
jgi:tripartite-type tricarboxylate transporter receptor subunit TctC